MTKFYKYHGAGNDFILINNLNHRTALNTQQIQFLCDRHRGIGADGLMMLLASSSHDFEMKYFNSDGREGSMCGNGGRCIIAFAYDMGLVRDTYHFTAIDGLHSGRILKNGDPEKLVELKMADVHDVRNDDEHFFIDTGSPHDLNFLQDVQDIDVFQEGKKIRYSDFYKEVGVNVNFIEEHEDKLIVRTYERGVENETLACGTGVTAAAIGSGIRQNLRIKNFDIETLGGKLNVRFQTANGKDFTKIYLTGPTRMVFAGDIILDRE